MKEVERLPKVGIYIKWKRPCREVFQNPLRLHILLGASVVGRFKCGGESDLKRWKSLQIMQLKP